MILKIETKQEVDARWIAEIINIPGALVYGKTKQEAINKVKFLVLSLMASDFTNINLPIIFKML